MKTGGQPATTLTVEHRVALANGAAFRRVVREMAETAAGRPGYLASQIVEPHSAQDTAWRVVVTFESEAALSAWRSSPDWIALSRRAEALAIGPATVQRVNGLEAWFQLPARHGSSPPPKWKTAIISGIGIYPLLLIMPYGLESMTQSMPVWLGTAVSVVIMSPLITWVVMPLVTRLFKPWLY